MNDLITYDLPNEQLFSIVLNLQDSYSQFTTPYINFLRKNDYGINYAGIKAYSEFLDKEYDEDNISGNTFNIYISTAKNRTRLLFDNSRSALDIAKRFFFNQKLDDIKLKKVDKIIEENKCLTPDEIRKLIDGCKDEGFKLLIEMAFKTAVRVSELLNIKLTSIKPFNDNWYLVTIKGKGNHERKVKLEKDLYDRINTYYNQSNRERLFEASKYGTPYTYQNVSMKIKRLAKKILNRETISIHSTRHSAATIAIKKGKSPKAVATWLGHSQVSTTLTYYVHDDIDTEDLEDIFEDF